MIFKNFYGEDISLREILSLAKKGYDYRLYIGTDSQAFDALGFVRYATCIVLHKRGKGGRIFVLKRKEDLCSSLRQRLTYEVWKSLEVALEAKKKAPMNVDIVIHVDANKSTKHKSGLYFHELAGMVTGQGFKVKFKPDSWVASSVSDRFSK